MMHKKMSPQMERVSQDLRFDRAQIPNRRSIDSAAQGNGVSRRRALSGCESPRAPNAETQWEVHSPDDISPLPPLEDMLDYQEQQEQQALNARQQHERNQTARAQRDRRRALSSCDSPRAPAVNLEVRTGGTLCPQVGSRVDPISSLNTRSYSTGTPRDLRSAGVYVSAAESHDAQMRASYTEDLVGTPLAPLNMMLDTPRTSARYVAGRPPPLTVNTEPVHELPAHAQTSQEASIRSPGIDLRPGHNSVLQLDAAKWHCVPDYWVLSGDLDDLDSTQLQFYPNLALDPAALPNEAPQADELNEWGDDHPSEQLGAAARASRRQALSSMDSPRAPSRTLHTTPAVLSPDSPLAPLNDMLDSPRGNNIYLMQTQPAIVPEALQVEAAVQSTRQPRPISRRAALSGCDSPRAPRRHSDAGAAVDTIPHSPLAPIDSMLDSPRKSQASGSQQQQRPSNVQTQPVPRRKALSSCASPRAPQQQNLKVVGSEEFSPLSPLVPLQNMFITPHASPEPPVPSVTQQKNRAARSRRQALSGPDSPRAPSEPQPGPGQRQQPVTPTPLAPLGDMVDTPRTAASYIYNGLDRLGGREVPALLKNTSSSWSSPEFMSSDSNQSNDHGGTNSEEQLDISLMQTRLSDAEDANIQWAEYCMQLQNYNSSLLQQATNTAPMIEMLQRQNSSLQKQSSQQRALSPEYEAALNVEAYADSPMSSPMSSPIPSEVLQNRRYALSGHDSPRAPSDTDKDFTGLPQSVSPEVTIRATSRSPSLNGNPVMPSSPLLQRLLNSSPKHPQIITKPPSVQSQESADAQSKALNSLMQALDACESAAVKDQVLNLIQSRSWIRDRQ